MEKLKKEIESYFDEEINANIIKINDLKNNIRKCQIELDEIDNIINELQEDVDQNSKDNMFSPTDVQNPYTLAEIKKLKDYCNKMKLQIDNDKSKKNDINKKIKELKRLKMCLDDIKIQDEEKSQNIDLTYIKEKINFCRKICLIDGNRCKIELNKIYDLLDNVSRETFFT